MSCGRGGGLGLAAVALVGGLIASSGAGGGSGRTVLAVGGQPQQAAAADAAAGAAGSAAAAACTPGDGGLPAPGNPRKDSLSRKPLPIPADMHALYVKAGKEYGLPWELLAGVGMIETGHWSDRGTSSAGARGPMQFMPGTWAGYGIDGDGDGVKGILNPKDAVPAAANYLKASGAPRDYRKALFAYNRANWYVNDVLWYARSYGAKSCDDAASSPQAAAAAGPVAGVG